MERQLMSGNSLMQLKSTALGKKVLQTIVGSGNWIQETSTGNDVEEDMPKEGGRHIQTPHSDRAESPICIYPPLRQQTLT